MLAIRSPAYEFGAFQLDPLGRSLTCRGQVIALPPKAVEVLTELVKRPGEVVGKKALMEAVWPEIFVEEANLNQMIFLLRRALRQGGGRDYIATVPRRGFRFTAGVRNIEIPCRIESMVVLPLANLSVDPTQEYFADGITEALITELAKVSSLRVVSRTTAMRYKCSTESLSQIARALRVQAVLEGSLTMCGDRLRITVQLIHGASDRHLWAESYDTTITDILAVQSQVARDVAAGLRAELSQEEEKRLAASRSRRVHPESYALYLNGCYFARQLTEAGQRKAIRYFQESLRLDPNYAPAHAALAECFIELPFFFGMEPKKAFAEAGPEAEIAVTLDEKLAAGHAVLGLLRLLNDWDWRTADEETRHALGLAPGDAYVYWKRGVFLRFAGRGDEAIAAHRRAESLDPLSPVAISEVGWALYYARRIEEAAAQFRRAVELEPNWDQLHFGLGLALVHQQCHAAAIEALRTATQLGPENPYNHATLVYALGRAGRAREAQQVMEHLAQKHVYLPHWFYSIMWMGLGEKERTLTAVEAAYVDREPCVVTLRVDPIFDAIREDRRFTDIVRGLGLEP